MSLKLVPKNIAAAATALDWTPWAALPGCLYIEAIDIKISASPTTSELMNVTYTPPTDASSVAGTAVIIGSVDPSTGANDTEKQNITFNINRRFPAGGIINVAYTNTDAGSIAGSVSYSAEF